MKTKKQILTIGLRETLKNIIQNELEQLPETLKDLESAERLNVLYKLMPYVFPKVVSINHKAGEPFKFEL